jgi:hypothetical protein
LVFPRRKYRQCSLQCKTRQVEPCLLRRRIETAKSTAMGNCPDCLSFRRAQS